MKRAFFIAAAISIAPLAPAQAGGMKGTDMKEAKGAAVHKANGQVKKVDPAKGTVTIQHGPVESLKWPSMTMAFKVKDKAMLDKVKPGDRVDFSFVQSGSDHTITEIR